MTLEALTTDERRFVRALRNQHNIAVRTGGPTWAVFAHGDQRRRSRARLGEDAVNRLAGLGYITVRQETATAATDRQLKMAEGSDSAPCLTLERAQRPGRFGFDGLADRAFAGSGPLSVHEVKAGLALRTAVDALSQTQRVSMNWSRLALGGVDEPRKIDDAARADRTKRASAHVAAFDRICPLAERMIVRTLVIEGASISQACRRYDMDRRALIAALKRGLGHVVQARADALGGAATNRIDPLQH